ncbi:MAG: hypothetical protein IPI60_17285 [Saprospiraceae bacterium]|nr:hypothetical protein [Saprospiraceae bacterium]
MKYFLLIMSLGLYLGCTKPPDIVPKKSCLDEVLEEYNMVPFIEGKPYCYSLYKHEFEGREYFVFDCCTCDMAADPFDCNGDFFARTNGEFDQGKYELFYQKNINLGVVGIMIN